MKVHGTKKKYYYFFAKFVNALVSGSLGVIYCLILARDFKILCFSSLRI
jgi:hypothetical protein